MISYLSGIPLLAVTAYSLCVYLYGSKLRWDLASSLLVLAVAGWSVGTVPAIIDGMVSVNVVMHNTQWVPGHFHIYLLLGEVAMSFGFMAWLVRGARAGESTMGGSGPGGILGLCRRRGRVHGDVPRLRCHVGAAQMGSSPSRMDCSGPDSHGVCRAGRCRRVAVRRPVRRADRPRTRLMRAPVFRSIAPVLGTLLLGVGVLWAATDGFRALTEESARRLHAAEYSPHLPDLVLQDMYGEDLALPDREEGPERLSLVGFIYTTCPTICQAAGSDFAKLRDALTENGLVDQVRLLSISFDPMRDDPEQMRFYADQHGAAGVRWTIARPRGGMLEPMLGGFGVRVIPDAWGGYQHNVAVHMVDGRGRLGGIFDTDDVAGILSAVRGELQ